MVCFRLVSLNKWRAIGFNESELNSAGQTGSTLNLIILLMVVVKKREIHQFVWLIIETHFFASTSRPETKTFSPLFFINSFTHSLISA